MELSEAKLKVKESYNIVDLVEQENVSLTVAGPGQYSGLCPFHNEKTPSFRVSEPFQNYRCFGCGASGDIFTFIQETRGCTFMEALKFLAESKGIEITSSYKGEEGPKTDIKRMYELLKDSYNFYRSEYTKLDSNHPAKKQVADRGLPLDHPALGYAPEKSTSLYELLKLKGYPEDLMLESELICEKDGKYFDFFYKRLVVTLSDFSGRPVSYSARKLFENDNRAKWVNGKASPVFQKKDTLFNLNAAKKDARISNKIILAEGPFDVLAIAEAGYKNSVASCGTAFTEGHLKSARQIVGENGELIFAFDGDKAGIDAALKIFLHFPVAHSISKVALFPEGQDPCDYLQAKGADEVKKIIDEAIPLPDFILKEVSRRFPGVDMDSRYKFVRILATQFLPVMTDNLLLDYTVRRASVISSIPTSAIYEIYEDSKKKKPSLRKPTEKVATAPRLDKEKLKISLNNLDDSDVCYVKSLSLLILHPRDLAIYLKEFTISDKFLPFLREFRASVNKTIGQGKPYRFLTEDYSDSEFAKLLQVNSEKMPEYGDKDELVNHFKVLMSHAEKVYKNQARQVQLSNTMNALSEAKTKEEVKSLLQLHDDHSEKLN